MATIKRKRSLANGSAAGKPNLTMAYGAVASDLLQRLGDAQAAQMGPPTSSEDKVAPATNEDRVKAWNTRNPEATDEAMLAMAQQKYQEHLQAGMDPEKAQRATAEDLTHFRYNQRLKIYTYGRIGFNEQVEAAERMAKVAARASTPNPLPPPPTMPTAQLTNGQMAAEPVPPPVAPPPAVPPAPIVAEVAPMVEGPDASNYGL
jgi:hypothetical protein